MARRDTEVDGQLTSKATYLYRTLKDKQWRVLNPPSDISEFSPVGVDSGTDCAYVLKPLDGRDALYRISLDGTLKTELVFSHPEVDVDGVVTIGRQGRVIGATYATDKPHVEYFEPTYRALAKGFAKALPNLPLVSFVSADATENVLLISAGSDDDPGHFYVYDKPTRSLAELMLVRPDMRGAKLAKVSPVEYKAADGTSVPGYLTLPPGVESPKGLPAIVMPHGGPAARDVWGFDWLAAILRDARLPRCCSRISAAPPASAPSGSSRTAFAAGRSPSATSSTAVDGSCRKASRIRSASASSAGPTAATPHYRRTSSIRQLFKAVIAIAPVTDLEMLKNESRGFTNSRLTARVRRHGRAHRRRLAGAACGTLRVTRAAVPWRARLQRRRDGIARDGQGAEVRRQASELVVYPDLDHQLHDDAAGRTCSGARSSSSTRSLR